MARDRHRTLALALAPLLAAAGVGLTALTARPFGGAYLYFPLVAVFVSALQGGLGPGVLTLVISALGADYFLLGPPRSFGVATVDELHRLTGFALVGLGSAWISSRYRAARLAAERSREEAQRVGALQERLVSVVSHDLRNPLLALRTGLDVLPRLGALEERQRSAVARMRRSAGRMERLIEDLLGFARSRHGGGFPVRPAPARLGEICERAVAEIREGLPERQIRLVVEGDDEGLLDAARLEQVASNLVHNAVVHGSPAGAVEVRVRGLPDELVLDVSNPGPPIPPDLLSHLFEPFRSGGRGGLGLGLFVVKEIAAAHGGRVLARSGPGGTAFEVRLPRRAGAGRAGGPKGAPDPRTPPGAAA